MDKDTQRIRQLDTLENAVIRNDPHEVDEMLGRVRYYDTSRALSQALRYSGPKMVKVLLKHGATLDSMAEMSTWGYSYSYSWREVGPDYDYLDLMFPAYWHCGGNRQESTVSAEDRLRCIDLLVTKDACSKPKLLYYALLFGDTEVVSLCKKHHVTFPEEYLAMLTGQLSVSNSRYQRIVQTTRGVFESWTDKQVEQAIARFNDYLPNGRFPALRYRILPIERLCAEKLFKFAYHNTDLGSRPKDWRLAQELVKAGNAEGLAYLLGLGRLSSTVERNYLLELARKDKTTNPQVISVLVEIMGESTPEEPQNELEITENDVLSEEAAQASWKYITRKNGTCTIRGYIGSDKDVVVPSQIGNYRVAGILSSAFSVTAQSLTPAIAASRARIQWVQFPGSVAELPDNLFNFRYNGNHTYSSLHKWQENKTSELTDAVLLDGIRTIGASAFQGCDRLENVQLPQSLESIGASAFAGCCALGAASLPDSLRSVESEAFKGCGLQTLHLPEEPCVLGTSAFAQCTKLRSVTIPGTIGTIPEDLFADCTDLEEVHIEDGITAIGVGAFAGCTQLTHIYIPDSVKSIGDKAFLGCSHLQAVSFPAHLETLGDEAFAESGLVHVQLSTKLKNMGKQIFARCPHLVNVEISEQITKLSDGMFEDCAQLTSLSMPKVSALPKNLIRGCKGLRSLIMPKHVKTGVESFYSCDELGDYEGRVITNGVLCGFTGPRDGNEMMCTPFALSNEISSIQLPERWSPLFTYWPSDLHTPLPEPQDVHPGATVQFGRFPLHADCKLEPITWQVLAVQDGTALLLSKQCLLRMPIVFFKTSSSAGNAWEVSELRKVLNGGFMEVAFSDEERAHIVGAKRTRKKPGSDDMPGFRGVPDDVFVLSPKEVGYYLETNADRMVTATEYARTWAKQRPAVSATDAVEWALCDMDAGRRNFVTQNGVVQNTSYTTTSSVRYIRPAIRIRL